ncbi:TPA: response regulator [Candidatus Poribacteria bacterium]|nr:response regulator [Candidatus Poribacteria bacterium]
MLEATHNILWIDDEIDILEPHICSLREKHYSVTPVSNGADAVAIIKESHYDVIILDQMMPGQDGITTLDQIREVNSTIPVIMVTQISDELFVEEALGKQIDSFLVKPIGVAQIVSTLKRVLDQDRIIEGQIPRNYTESFNEIRKLIQGHSDWRIWVDIYLKLLSWDLAFDELGETGFKETHKEQKKELVGCVARIDQSYQ